jgi:peptidoglycan/LPS O-acetylase OafA/YrhL
MERFAERTSFRHTAASVTLDALRGIAALLVLFDHTHNLFFVNFDTAAKASSHPWLLSGLYAFGSAGAEVVVIFFVLSGYLISSSVFRAVDQERWSWKDYLTHRCVRLWLVLLPALLLCGVWDSARLALAVPAAGMSLPARMAAAGLTWRIFLGNVFFLQTIRTSTFGSDRVLWSLAAEFWYYMLFPLGLFAIRRGTLTKRLLYGVGFVAVAVFITRGVFDLFPVWLCGTALALVKPPKVGAAARWAATVAYVPVVFFLAAVSWPWHIFKMDYLLGILTGLFLWVMLSADQRIDDRKVGVRVIRTLAGFSYSLYLVHYPFLAFWAAMLNHGVGWMPTWKTLGIAGFCSTCAIAYGYGVASVTEFRNDSVRRWVEYRFFGMPVARRAPVTP